MSIPQSTLTDAMKEVVRAAPDAVPQGLTIREVVLSSFCKLLDELHLHGRFDKKARDKMKNAVGHAGTARLEAANGGQ